MSSDNKTVLVRNRNERSPIKIWYFHRIDNCLKLQLSLQHAKERKLA